MTTPATSIVALSLACAALAAGCGGSSGPVTPTPHVSPDTATAACRAGREAPVGTSAAVDYVSFVQYGGTLYVNRDPSNAASPSAVGPVIGEVACHLDALPEVPGTMHTRMTQKTES